MNLALKTASFYWHHIWQYPKSVFGVLCAVPITVLVSNYLPPLILSTVLNRLSRHQYLPHHVWASFGGDLIAYAALSLFGAMVTWRIVDHLIWNLEGQVQRAIAQHVFRHLMSQGADFHANQFAGSLVSQSSKLMSSYVRMADMTVF